MSQQPCASRRHRSDAPQGRGRRVDGRACLREAAIRALEDADLTWADIDAVVIGKAPDAFEGVVKPELFLADALGAAGKPMLRVHTAGSVGGSTFIVGVAPRRVAASTTGCWRSRGRSSREGNAQWGLAGGRGRAIGAGGAFAPWIRAYIEAVRRARVHRLAWWRSRTGSTR